MAFQLKCDVYYDYNQIVIEDSSGNSDASSDSVTYNSTGWGSNNSVEVSDLTSITLNVGGVSITIDSSTNQDVLPDGDFDSAKLHPYLLTYTLNKSTLLQADYEAIFQGLEDGEITIDYSVVVNGTTYTYSTTSFRYKDIEEAVWEKFHDIAYNNKAYDRNDDDINNALFCHALLLSLEYLGRTSSDFVKAGEILTILENIVNLNIYNVE